MRGTTPTHSFTLPVTAENIKTIKIIYAQNGKVVLEKWTADVHLEDSRVMVRLSQEETMRFCADAKVEIQVRLLTLEGEALKSNILITMPTRLLDEEVLV